MSYDYQMERNNLFSEDGVKLLFRIMTGASKLTLSAGCFAAHKVYTGDAWQCLAALEYLDEIGQLVSLSKVGPAQNWIYRSVS